MTMTTRAGLAVAAPLAAFVEDQALPGSGIAPEAFWAGFAALLERFAPQNRALLAERERLQQALDAWHEARVGQAFDAAAHEAFLREIGYLVPEVLPFQVDPWGWMRSWRNWPGRNSWCRSSTRGSCSMPPTRAGAAFTMPSMAPMPFRARRQAPAMTRRAVLR
jgi:hypothetical protein